MLPRRFEPAPMWSLDGERLVFIVSDERGDATIPSRSRSRGREGEYRRQFDLLPNGREFVMLFPILE